MRTEGGKWSRFLLARGDGMTVRDAAAFAEVGVGAAKRRSAGALPCSYTGRPWSSGQNPGRRGPNDPKGARVKKIEIGGCMNRPTGPLGR